MLLVLILTFFPSATSLPSTFTNTRSLATTYEYHWDQLKQSARKHLNFDAEQGLVPQVKGAFLDRKDEVMVFIMHDVMDYPGQEIIDQLAKRICKMCPDIISATTNDNLDHVTSWIQYCHEANLTEFSSGSSRRKRFLISALLAGGALLDVEMMKRTINDNFAHLKNSIKESNSASVVLKNQVVSVTNGLAVMNREVSTRFKLLQKQVNSVVLATNHLKEHDSEKIKEAFNRTHRNIQQVMCLTLSMGLSNAWQTMVVQDEMTADLLQSSLDGSFPFRHYNIDYLTRLTQDAMEKVGLDRETLTTQQVLAAAQQVVPSYLYKGNLIMILSVPVGNVYPVLQFSFLPMVIDRNNTHRLEVYSDLGLKVVKNNRLLSLHSGMDSSYGRGFWIGQDSDLSEDPCDFSLNSRGRRGCQADYLKWIPRTVCSYRKIKGNMYYVGEGCSLGVKENINASESFTAFKPPIVLSLKPGKVYNLSGHHLINLGSIDMPEVLIPFLPATRFESVSELISDEMPIIPEVVIKPITEYHPNMTWGKQFDLHLNKSLTELEMVRNVTGLLPYLGKLVGMTGMIAWLSIITVAVALMIIWELFKCWAGSSHPRGPIFRPVSMT